MLVRIYGLALIAAGALLTWQGHESSQRLGNQLNQVLAGQDTNDVKLLYGAGAVAIALGVIGVVYGSGKKG